MNGKKTFSVSRLKRLWILAYIACAVIAVRLVDIQIIRHEDYKNQANKNRIQLIYQVAPRGNIYTADGVLVAGNKPSFDLYYLPAAASQKVEESELISLAEELAPRLKEKTEIILDKLKAAVKSGKAATIAENLSVSSILPIAELQNYYPGIYLIEESKRYYPEEKFAGHLIGYMSSMEGADWKNRDLSMGYRLDSKIGRFGIEKKYEREMKGTDGGLLLEVDSRGRVKSIIENRKSEAGQDIYLTLNSKMQKAAEKGLRESLTGRGAAVALDVKTGAVLAIVSEPGFDPNIFVPFNEDGDMSADIRKVEEFNLAVQGVYPPASTFKVITAFAALDEGKLNTETKVFCPGSYDAGARVFKCWATHHHENFYDAMADSCDVYFYVLSNRVGAAAIERVQNKFMFGRLTGIDIQGERSGNMFGPSKRAKNKSYWYVGDTLNLSIGQGELLATPVKMAQFSAAIASRGKIFKPYYVDRMVSAEGVETFKGGSKILSTAQFSKKDWDIIWKGLKEVADRGTGRRTKIRGLDVYTKTGTAQNPHGDDHAWIMSYAGREGQEPEIALAVFVEHGKHGSSVAGPIAREMMKAYFDIEDWRAPVSVKADTAPRAVHVSVETETSHKHSDEDAENSETVLISPLSW
ncbi:penicillin-binding protein 2 [Parelusimicrobium proximum]|uniref:penicillin-binding protein 2 n=1 Tax=Parelusimicrobium proximum TaxID=3228953 RepID=UPI003D17CA05